MSSRWHLSLSVWEWKHSLIFKVTISIGSPNSYLQLHRVWQGCEFIYLFILVCFYLVPLYMYIYLPFWQINIFFLLFVLLLCWLLWFVLWWLTIWMNPNDSMILTLFIRATMGFVEHCILPQVKDFKYQGLVQERQWQSMRWCVLLDHRGEGGADRQEAKLLIYQSTYIPTLSYCLEHWLVCKMSSSCRAARLSP